MPKTRNEKKQRRADNARLLVTVGILLVLVKLLTEVAG